jgi:hypothetical protein
MAYLLAEGIYTIDCPNYSLFPGYIRINLAY